MAASDDRRGAPGAPGNPAGTAVTDRSTCTDTAPAGAAASRAFETLDLADAPAVIAPDGSDVRVLLGLAAGGMARFRLEPGQVSRAVVHRSVEEVWYVVDGRGEMWRGQGEREMVTSLVPGVCLTLPRGTRFQFRAADDAPVVAVAITMPPWPGDDEALPVVGPWVPTCPPSVASGPQVRQSA